MTNLASQHSIAIVGMACRFPQADTSDEFWSNLLAGKDCVRRFTLEELQTAGVVEELLRDPNYVLAGSVVHDIEQFDCDFFDFSPADGQALDPQHRVFLECSYAALEDAGYDPRSLRSTVAVFAGVGDTSYFHENLASHPQLLKTLGPLRTRIATSNQFIATLVAYKLDLTGPCMTLSTACSSSLVAVHSACQALLAAECDVALAGGVSIILPQTQGYLHVRDGILSADGTCRTFDARASGTVPGRGGAVVALRRLDDAIADRNPIIAVIAGTAVNNDGASKAGFSAPSVDGQVDVVRQAFAVAGVTPRQVSYVEAHGTATAIGDAIEIEALREVFAGCAGHACGIGSVKSNLGHLDTASGVAGLIKTALAIQHRQLPPTLHFEAPHRELELERSPFHVVHRVESWGRADEQLTAGVSSFGVGGTNAHVVLQSYVDLHMARWSPQPFALIPLSARTPSALAAARARLGQHLCRHPELTLDQVAYTLQIGRPMFAFRDTCVCSDLNQLIEWLMHDGEQAPLAVQRRAVGIKSQPDAEMSDAVLHGLEALFPGVQVHFERDQAATHGDAWTRPGAGKAWQRGVFGLIRDMGVVAQGPAEEARDQLLVRVPLPRRESTEAQGIAEVASALLKQLAALWRNGSLCDWTPLWVADQPTRARLPGYPLERTRCWVEPARPAREHAPSQPTATGASALASSHRARSLQAQLRELLERVTGSTIESDDVELKSALDSMAALALVSEIGEQLKCEISMRTLLQQETLQALSRLVERQLEQGKQERRLDAG